jgi:hypothetical protein
MVAGKVINNVIIFGGIGAMAYLLLKKKPVVEQTPTTKKFIGGFEESDYNKSQAIKCANEIIDDKKDNIFWRDPEFVKRCVDLQEKSELTETLVDQSVLGITQQHDQYYTNTGDIRANTCLELDWFIKIVNNDVLRLAKSNVNTDYLRKVKQDAEAKFKKFNCRDKIEAVRTKNLIDLQSKGSINAEKNIVTKGFTEQKTYIIIGALVLLTGFYIVVKK